LSRRPGRARCQAARRLRKDREGLVPPLGYEGRRQRRYRARFAGKTFVLMGAPPPSPAPLSGSWGHPNSPVRFTAFGGPAGPLNLSLGRAACYVETLLTRSERDATEPVR